MPSTDFVTSGQLAALVGRSRETIRRYEALGLIPAGRRDPINGRRYWSAHEAETIRRSLQPLTADSRRRSAAPHSRNMPKVSLQPTPAEAADVQPH